MKRAVVKFLLALIAVALCLPLTGCALTTFLTPAETIRAPRVTGEFEGVRTALEASVGKDIVMKYPKGDDGVASYMTADLDGDGTNEVLAYYCQKAEASLTRINVLKSDTDGKWTSVQDIDPVGIELDSVRFSDLDNDGCQEVVTGWNMYDTKNREMAIYKMDNGALTQRASERYTEYTLFDINDDLITEIVILLLSSADKTASVNSFAFNGIDGITVAGSVLLDGGVTSYAQILTGYTTEGFPAMYVDAFKGSSATLTELVYWDGEKLVNPYYDEETGETTSTLRPYTEYCRIREDGSVEIPFSSLAFGQDATDSSALYFTHWKLFRTGGDTVEEVTFRCDDYGYYFSLPQRWYDNTSVTYGSDTSVLIFFTFFPETGISGNEKMRIRVFGSGQNDEALSLGYEILETDRSYIYTVRTGQTAEAVTVDEAAESFRLS